jgi:two-component system, chemotaxis family, chemotaxis protein CheY
MPNVLIVDDSPVVRKVARRILEGMNFRATEASNGAEALTACSLSMPDAMFVDACMPEIDGFEFVRRVRKLPGGHDPRIVFCMSDNNIAQIARAAHAGANEFMLKPFDRDGLAAKFADLFGR